jgi:hypothetical protein
MKMTTETKTREQETAERLREIGKSAYESIAEMVANLERAQEIEAGRFDWEEEAERLGFAATAGTDDDGDQIGFYQKPGEEARFDDAEEACRSVEEYPDEEEARQAIEEDPLSLQVRSGWASLGEELKAEEFELLLGTGGPAIRIIGELDQYGEPDSARLQTQDWFTPWTDYFGASQDTLLAYCRCFYFAS